MVLLLSVHCPLHLLPRFRLANFLHAGERDFEDLKLLISHQKAKHFKCDRCGKRLNTAGGKCFLILCLAQTSVTDTLSSQVSPST